MFIETWTDAQPRVVSTGRRSTQRVVGVLCLQWVDLPIAGTAIVSRDRV